MKPEVINLKNKLQKVFPNTKIVASKATVQLLFSDKANFKSYINISGIKDGRGTLRMRGLRNVSIEKIDEVIKLLDISSSKELDIAARKYFEEKDYGKIKGAEALDTLSVELWNTDFEQFKEFLKQSPALRKRWLGSVRGPYSVPRHIPVQLINDREKNFNKFLELRDVSLVIAKALIMEPLRHSHNVIVEDYLIFILNKWLKLKIEDQDFLRTLDVWNEIDDEEFPRVEKHSAYLKIIEMNELENLKKTEADRIENKSW